VKERSFDGEAGCVVKAQNKVTRTVIAVYNAEQAGLDSDGTWVTTCEEHKVMIGNRTLRLAKMSAAYPWAWCDECRSLVEGRNDAR
jgi:hypothetical protein